MPCDSPVLVSFHRSTFVATGHRMCLDSCRGLSGNSITTLPVGIFGDLVSLQWLDLGFNELTSVDAGLFDGLVSLTRL